MVFLCKWLHHMININNAVNKYIFEYLSVNMRFYEPCHGNGIIRHMYQEKILITSAVWKKRLFKGPFCTALFFSARVRSWWDCYHRDPYIFRAAGMRSRSKSTVRICSMVPFRGWYWRFYWKKQRCNRTKAKSLYTAQPLYKRSPSSPPLLPLLFPPSHPLGYSRFGCIRIMIPYI